MQDQPTGPDGPTTPTVEQRVSMLEVAIVKLHARLEENTIDLSERLEENCERIEDVIRAQGRAAQSLGALNTLLADISSMEGRRTGDDR